MLQQEAFKNKQQDVCELMELMRRSIIEACIYKNENNIPTQAKDRVLAIADSNRNYVKAKERLEIIEDSQSLQKVYWPKIKEDSQDQMSLF